MLGNLSLPFIPCSIAVVYVNSYLLPVDRRTPQQQQHGTRDIDHQLFQYLPISLPIWSIHRRTLFTQPLFCFLILFYLVYSFYASQLPPTPSSNHKGTAAYRGQLPTTHDQQRTNLSSSPPPMNNLYIVFLLPVLDMPLSIALQPHFTSRLRLE